MEWYRSESVRAVDARVSSVGSYEDELAKEKSVELTAKDSAACQLAVSGEKKKKGISHPRNTISLC